jgi:hypothetical protein
MTDRMSTEPQPLTAEEAFIAAINAPSATGRGLAVPHYRDGERIWAAVRPYLDAARAVPALDATAWRRTNEQEGHPDLPKALLYDPLSGDGDFQYMSLEDRLDRLAEHHRSLGFHDGYAARSVPSLDAERLAWAIRVEFAANRAVAPPGADMEMANRIAAYVLNDDPTITPPLPHGDHPNDSYRYEGCPGCEALSDQQSKGETE